MMKKVFSNLGTSLLECAVLVGLVSIICLTGITLMGEKSRQSFCTTLAEWTAKDGNNPRDPVNGAPVYGYKDCDNHNNTGECPICDDRGVCFPTRC